MVFKKFITFFLCIFLSNLVLASNKCSLIFGSKMTNFDNFHNFLIKRKYTSQFLLSFLKSEEDLKDSIQLGKLFIIQKSSELRFVAFISPSNTLHIQGELDSTIFKDLILFIDGKNLKGLNGPANLVSEIMQNKKFKYKTKETYEDYVYNLKLPVLLKTNLDKNKTARRLKFEDFNMWHELYISYLKEMDLSISASEDQRREKFQKDTQNNWHWGAFDSTGNLMSIASFNATSNSSAQIGGVFTPSQNRRSGWSQIALSAMIEDAYSIHGLDELILFTGPQDTPAGSLYDKLGFQVVDRYTMVIF